MIVVLCFVDVIIKINIDLSSFQDTKNVNNMSFMFSFINNMSRIFCFCKSLKSLPDISNWDTKNVNDMCYMFCCCKSLESLPDISKWAIKNVDNMSRMFYYINNKSVNCIYYLLFFST